MNNLREQLAERMFRAVEAAPPADEPGWRKVMTRDIALTLADECIRQMEWARWDAIDQFSGGYAEASSEVLRAAPEGWKVPE